MPLFFTDEHHMLREMVREYAENELAKLAPEMDKQNRFFPEVKQRLQELNLLGIMVDEQYGGVGADTLSYAIVMEEICKVCASAGVVVSVHNSLACGGLQDYGTEAQKQKYLAPLASGDILGGFCLTEAGSGSDASNMQTTAELVGDYYLLNGSKVFVSMGSEAELFLVAARSDRAKGIKGISVFLVEPGMEGFVLGQEEDKMGMRGCSTHEISFNNCKVPKENLLGKEGEGFKIFMKLLDSGRIGIAAQALGIAAGALQLSIDYAKERRQFNKPIASFQAIQWMLADMHTRVDAARHMVYNAARVKDAGQDCALASAMAKVYAAEAAMWVTTKAVQIHGGYGYVRGYNVERFMRDAKVTEIYEGTSEIQRLVIASRILS